MGYDLHITRKDFWSDEEGPIISLDEWIDYVSSDAEIEKDSGNDGHDYLYVKHPLLPIPLWWRDGEIFTKSPDKYTVKKIIQIALEFEARVLGDDGESYSDWTRFPLPDPPNERPKKKGFFSKLFGK